MDEALLVWINQGWAHPWLDGLFAWLSSRGFSLPLLALLVALLARRHGRDGLKLGLLLIALVIGGDALGNGLKHLIGQPRPCAEIPELLRLAGKAAGEACKGAEHSGMPSNHALNFFLTAAFLGAALRSWLWGLSLGTIAVAVALSRVYLGVHYPTQILAGGMFGATLGFLAAQAALTYGAFAHRILAVRELRKQ